MSNSKLSVRTCSGTIIIDFNEIMYCAGDGRYTKLFLDNGVSHLCVKTLKTYETILPENSFFRIHKSCIVNLDFIKEYKVNGEKVVVLNDNTRHLIAKRRDKLFRQRIQENYLSI